MVFAMKTLALSAIVFYQRHISPRKGFCCAYRAHTGRASCSALAYRAIRRYGVWLGLAVLRLRLQKCSAIHHAPLHAQLRRQAGFCDAGCDLPCDIESGEAACDIWSNCAPGDCKFWRRSPQKPPRRL
jgi:putative component of membrane protein insertase Oxa1/YidC/SpoIIIJ protein YidD